MGIFPGFDSWINQNTQQPREEESESSENENSESRSETNTHEERDEMMEQLKLWRDAEKKEQWQDAPPKVKVETRHDLELGMSTIKMQFTLGLPPQAAYDVLTNPDNQSYFRFINGREILENISRKVVSPDNGKGQIVNSKKALVWNFLDWSGAIPLTVDLIENRQSLTVQYTVKNKLLIKSFEGQYKLEPIYVDSERLCKHKKPNSREEYEECSGRQGKIATKVTLDQIFKPSFIFNLPPLSWYVRRITIKTMKTLIEDLQVTSAIIRGV